MAPQFILAIIAIAVIIIIAVKSRELFDAYNNHIYGAQRIYNGDLSLHGTALETKYNWARKCPDGLNIYDYLYEEHVRDLNGAPIYDYLDNKFDILGDPMNYKDNQLNSIAAYNFRSSIDAPFVYTIVNGEKIYLAQKQY